MQAAWTEAAAAGVLPAGAHPAGGLPAGGLPAGGLPAGALPPPAALGAPAAAGGGTAPHDWLRAHTPALSTSTVCVHVQDQDLLEPLAIKDLPGVYIECEATQDWKQEAADMNKGTVRGQTSGAGGEQRCYMYHLTKVLGMLCCKRHFDIYRPERFCDARIWSTL